MHITFLGTSHGVPEADRYCSCTLVTVGESRYLIDAGGPVMDMLLRRGVQPSEIGAIFVTHMHGDHTNGLPAFTDLISWYFKSAVPYIYLPDQRGVDALRIWNTAIHGRETRILNYKVFEEGIIYSDGIIRVTAIKTRHTRLSYAFLLEADDKSVLFTGDLSATLEDFPEYCFSNEVSAIICESAHFPVTCAANIFSRCRTENIIINHIAPRMEPAIGELIATNPPYKLTAAYDGMEIEI